MAEEHCGCGYIHCTACKIEKLAAERDAALIEIESYKKQLSEWYDKLQGTDENWKAALLQIQKLQKVVDAAVEWWADPHDTTKTIVDLQNAVEAYWEEHKTEKPKCELDIPCLTHDDDHTWAA